ncbi:MAG: ATP:cob(I)alamin adenosyltransferase [Oscillospiraceae bacterium]
MKIYKSKFEQYPFLTDDYNDLKCDFEILTDGFASEVGYLLSKVNSFDIKEQLTKICELVYHLNPTLRTNNFTVSEDEFNWVLSCVHDLRNDYGHLCDKFVLPIGCESACLCHMLRSSSKILTRMIYRYVQQGNLVDDIVFDFTNLLSAYFFYLALKLNKENSIVETKFISRNYK